MTLNELEKLADAAKVFGTNYSTGVAQPLYESVRVLPQTIKQLIALCRLQHEALKADPDLRDGKAEDALAAYEEFGK